MQQPCAKKAHSAARIKHAKCLVVPPRAGSHSWEQDACCRCHRPPPVDKLCLLEPACSMLVSCIVLSCCGHIRGQHNTKQLLHTAGVSVGLTIGGSPGRIPSSGGRTCMPTNKAVRPAPPPTTPTPSHREPASSPEVSRQAAVQVRRPRVAREPHRPVCLLRPHSHHSAHLQQPVPFPSQPPRSPFIWALPRSAPFPVRTPAGAQAAYRAAAG